MNGMAILCKAAWITLVWTCTENGRKLDSQKSIVYESGNNKTGVLTSGRHFGL